VTVVADGDVTAPVIVTTTGGSRLGWEASGSGKLCKPLLTLLGGVCVFNHLVTLFAGSTRVLSALKHVPSVLWVLWSELSCDDWTSDVARPSNCGNPLKPHPPPSSRNGMQGTEDNDLKRVKAVRMIESEMGNPHAKPLCARSV
jgi:hypothetical protein